MLVAGVVGNLRVGVSALIFVIFENSDYEVHDNFDSERMGLSEKLIQVCIRSEHLINILEVSNIVTIVDLGRF